MKTPKRCLYLLAAVVVGTLVGCSTTSTKAADVADSIRTSLDQAGQTCPQECGHGALRARATSRRSKGENC